MKRVSTSVANTPSIQNALPAGVTNIQRLLTFLTRKNPGGSATLIGSPPKRSGATPLSAEALDGGNPLWPPAIASSATHHDTNTRTARRFQRPALIARSASSQ